MITPDSHRVPGRANPTVRRPSKVIQNPPPGEHLDFHAVVSVVEVLLRGLSDEWPASRFRRPFGLGRLAPILDFLGEPVAS